MSDIDDYILTRGEFAKKIGKSKNAVRLAMRRGLYADQYRFDGSKFLFKDPTRPRDIKDQDYGQIDPTQKKKKINRGNHYNAKYPNEAFRKYNEAKMLKAVNETDPNFIKDYHAIKQEYKIRKAKEVMRRANPDDIFLKNYGRMLRGYDNISWENDLKKIKYDNRGSSYHLTGKPYAEAKDDTYPGSEKTRYVEVIPAADDLTKEPRFKNKIDEEIWRLKRKK